MANQVPTVELRPACNTVSEPEAFDTKAPGIGRVQKLKSAFVSLRTQMFVPDGAWALAGISTGMTGGKREVFATLVRVRSMEAK